MRFMSTKKVGELNGPWAFMFKLSNILLPMVVAWCVWATNQIYVLEIRQAKTEQWMNQGPRFTAVDAERLRLQILEEVGKDMRENQKVLLASLESLHAEIIDLKITMKTHINTHTNKQ